MADERTLARRVLDSLRKEWSFAGRVFIEEVSWDDPENPAALDARLTPQQAIDRERPKPSECDVVVVILWSRLGTPLPDDSRKPDGTHYRSGTEWEFCDALASAEKSGRPTVWLYRRDEDILVARKDPERDEKLRQADLVDAFFEELKNPDGSLRHSFRPYSKPEDFRQMFEKHLREWLGKRLARAGKPAPKTASDETAAADLPELPRYRDAALAQHETLLIAGFKTKARVAIRLDELYVPLRAMLDTRFTGDGRFADAEDAELCLKGHGAPEIPLAEAFSAAFARNRRGLVVLGDPGSGKTTQLKRLLLACFREGPESLGLPAGTVPVFLPLRNLEDLGQGVDAFIESTLDSRHLAMSPGFGRKLLERGKLLLLFDGLDEVADAGQRARVSAWIEALARARRDCTVAVTCRFAGYEDAARLPADLFLELHVRPLTEDQSDAFIRNWHRAVKTSQHPGPAALAEAEEEAGQLIGRLREPEYRAARVAMMKRNPLLLANLCLVHYDRKGSLPKERHRLYAVSMEVLLELWRREHKGLAVSVDFETGRSALGPVALWLHGEENRTRASLAELRPILEPALAGAGWAGDAAAFLGAVRDESGLLTGWSQEQYGFMHLGFQEYLAAWEIRRLVHRQALACEAPVALAELAGHYGESWWAEVILLLLAESNPAPLFEPFMRLALEQPGFDADGELTRFILEEAAGVSSAPFRNFLMDAAYAEPRHLAAKKSLLRILQAKLGRDEFSAFLEELPPGVVTKATTMVEAQYAIQGDENPISRTGNVELLLIPAGRFLMGSPPGVGHDDERPQHEVEIRPFYLGRHPVTNEEYARYLAANPGAKEPAHWAGRRFNQARQPVVGVNWEDAKRFCAWAGGRLPTEAEWEYACRAGTVTEFHWGDDDGPAAEFAWFGEDWQKGSTHPVGEKQPNPWGLHDLTGNVWEWTLDVWHDNYEGAPADGSAWMEGGNGGRRVVRGGSWGGAPVDLRSAFRYRNTPGGRDGTLGFRLAQDLN